jgi:plastocyanin
MRPARLRSSSVLLVAISVAFLAACNAATPGWTYVPAPSATPVPSSAGSEPPTETGDPNVVKISASGIKFEQTTVTAPATLPFQISFENKDAGTPHDISIRQGGPTGPELFKGPAFNGVATRVYDVPALDAGAYSFVCTIHPTMTGTLNAE